MDNVLKSIQMAEFFGIMTGDGCLSNTGKGKGSGNKYWIYICGHKIDDRKHYGHIKNLLKDIFNKETKICERKKENAIFIRFSDKSIFQNLVRLGFPIGKKYDKLNVPAWICNKKKNFIYFLRGLFDTDGSFVLSKQHREIPYYPRIEIVTKSRYLAEKVKELINKLGIRCSLNRKKEYFRLEVAGNTNCSNWMKIIGTKNKKHLTKYNTFLKKEEPR